jgi:hypothetical protein
MQTEVFRCVISEIVHGKIVNYIIYYSALMQIARGLGEAVHSSIKTHKGVEVKLP